jgi:prepilin peptidase CpaA
MWNYILLTIVVIVAAVSDVRHHRIPNTLVYPGMVVALAGHGLTGGSNAVLFSIGGLTLGMTLLGIPYCMGWMGAGDVKLMGLAGSMLGPKAVMITVVLSTLVGGIYALISIVSKHRSGEAPRTRTTIQRRGSVVDGCAPEAPHCSRKGQPGVPYGLAIATGVLIYIVGNSLGYDFLI